MLFLSPVWPERSSSAAGVRTADLIDGFKEWGYSVAYSRWGAYEHSKALLWVPHSQTNR